jgi:hypothetical protein
LAAVIPRSTVREIRSIQAAPIAAATSGEAEEAAMVVAEEAAMAVEVATAAAIDDLRLAERPPILLGRRTGF